MTKEQFLHLLKNPQLISYVDTFDFENIVSDFPFFQTARALYLKGLKNQNSFRFKQTLKTTAIYTPDRSILFKFITSSDFENTSLKNDEQRIISELDAIDQNIQKLSEVKSIDVENLEELEIDDNVNEKLEELFELHQIKGHENELVNDVENQENPFLISENLITENNTSPHDDFPKPSEENNDFFISNTNVVNDFENIIAEDFLKQIEDEKNENFDMFLSHNKDKDVEKEITEHFAQLDEEEVAAAEDFNIHSIAETPTSAVEKEIIEHFAQLDKEEVAAAEDFSINSIAETPTSAVEKEEILFELIPFEIFINETPINEVVEEKITNSSPESEIEEKLSLKMDEDFSPPVVFNQNDTKSFSDWLRLSSFKPINRENEPILKVSKEKKINLIEEFIAKNPKIETKVEKDVFQENNQQNADNEEIMTETLARLYVLQNKYSDAIRAYRILSLKFPEKSSFFANQIRQIELLRKK